jgi:hypothetical protein
VKEPFYYVKGGGKWEKRAAATSLRYA